MNGLLRRLGFFFSVFFLCIRAEAACKRGCKLAIASYYVWQGSNLSYISNILGQSTENIVPYNPNISNPNSIQFDSRVDVPFSCDCINGDFLGHTFNYTTQYGDTYAKVAKITFSNLTTPDWVQRVNNYESTDIPDYANINVTINCSCGNGSISKTYGLFATYPLRPGENLSSVALVSSVPADLLQRYNPGSNFSAGSGIVYVPAKG